MIDDAGISEGMPIREGTGQLLLWTLLKGTAGSLS